MTPRPAVGESAPAWERELLPKAREVAAALGGVPSRNRLMRELHVGAVKARILREALTRGRTGSATPDPLRDVSNPVDDEPDPDPDRAASVGVDARHTAVRPVRSWPVVVLAAPALVAIWSGWVGLGELTGFGPVHPLPGIWDSLVIDTAITLPIGVETYAAYALRAWLSADRAPGRARTFAKWSALGALLLGATGQVVYHLMTAAGVTAAPWPVTTLVSCLPVAVLGMGAALAHLLNDGISMNEGR